MHRFWRQARHDQRQNGEASDSSTLEKVDWHSWLSARAYSNLLATTPGLKAVEQKSFLWFCRCPCVEEQPESSELSLLSVPGSRLPSPSHFFTVEERMTLTLRGKNRATLSPKEKSYKMKQSSIFEYIYNEELCEYVTVPPLPSISFPTEKEFETPKKLKGGNTSKRAGESTEGEKKPAFERVWSKNDEVNLLEALVKYIQNKQGGPDSKSFDMTQFYATLDLLFHQKFTRDQVAGKVRKLKQKYKKNIGRKQKMNGDKDLSFSKLHDLKLFQLSEKVWVDEALDLQHTPSNNLYFDGLEEYLRENGLSLNILDEKDKMTLEKKWNDFQFSEWVTFSKKAALIKEMMEQKLIAYGQDTFGKSFVG